MPRACACVAAVTAADVGSHGATALGLDVCALAARVAAPPRGADGRQVEAAVHVVQAVSGEPPAWANVRGLATWLALSGK